MGSYGHYYHVSTRNNNYIKEKVRKLGTGRPVTASRRRQVPEDNLQKERPQIMKINRAIPSWLIIILSCQFVANFFPFKRYTLGGAPGCSAVLTLTTRVHADFTTEDDILYKNPLTQTQQRLTWPQSHLQVWQTGHKFRASYSSLRFHNLQEQLREWRKTLYLWL